MRSSKRHGMKILRMLLILVACCVFLTACNQYEVREKVAAKSTNTAAQEAVSAPAIFTGSESTTEETASDPAVETNTEMQSWSEFRATLYSVLPDINSFSGEDCADFDRYFFPVETSAFYSNGVSKELPSDDARLTRLKNYILSSEEDGSAGWSFGYLREEDLQTYYESFPSYIRLSFDNPEGKNPSGLTIDGVYGLREMVIFADRYVLIGAFDNGDLCMEEHFPFMSTLSEYVDASGYADEAALQYADPNAPWIDMLQYCGLIQSEASAQIDD